MVKVAATELRNASTETLNRVQYRGERVIVERRGKAVAAIVPVEDVALLEALEDRIDLATARKALKEPGSKSLEDVRAARTRSQKNQRSRGP
jgi:prevent-host-death family protein